MAGLLERDEIVLAVPKSLTKRNGILDHAKYRVCTHAMRIGCCIFQQKLGMLLQRTTAVVEIMNLYLHMLGIA